MKQCDICDAVFTEEQDPYGTGDWCYVVYEPTCDCEDSPQEDKPDSLSLIKGAVLQSYADYMKENS